MGFVTTIETFQKLGVLLSAVDEACSFLVEFINPKITIFVGFGNQESVQVTGVAVVHLSLID